MECKEKTKDKKERQTKKIEVKSTFADLSLMSPESTTSTPIPTFKIPRELVRQSTRPVPRQGTLLDILNPKARKHAIELQKNNSLFSIITDGLDCSPLVKKVVIALSQTQYEQSLQTGNKKLLTGISEDTKREIERQLPSPLPEPQSFGEKNSYGQEVKTPFAYIIVDRIEFAKKVNGGIITGGKDIEGVMDILSELERKEIFIDLGEHYRSTKLLTILGRDIDKTTGRELLFIQLSPLFARAISHDYVTGRTDILLMMRGKQNKVTMKLYDVLIEAISFRGENSKQHNDKYFKIDKGLLFDRIAPLISYKKNPKRRETDYATAIQKVKEWLLITDYKEEYKNSGIMCIFTLNPEWRTAPTPQRYLK